MINNELLHFGVKGMRWGVRKTVHPDAAASRSAGRKKVWAMSDDELKTYVERKKLEKDFKSKSSIVDKFKNKKRVEEMSNDEINSFIKRKDLEKEYRTIREKESEQFLKWANATLKYAWAVKAANYNRNL